MGKLRLKSRYVWYCLGRAGLNKKNKKMFPRFDTVKKAKEDIIKKGGCSPMCEDEIVIYDLQEDKIVWEKK